jgi:hypothetical protein
VRASFSVPASKVAHGVVRTQGRCVDDYPESPAGRTVIVACLLNLSAERVVWLSLAQAYS